jgi:CubicO group peptidase (beta-lactamase class C family)
MSTAGHEHVSPQVAELDATLIELVASLMKRYAVPGLALGLLVEGEESLHGFGITSVENPLPVDADTIFVAGSVTKTVVATTVMCLVERDVLDLDRPIRAYLPDLRLADERVASSVNLRHLLTHSAGWAGDDIDDRDFGCGDDALARAIATFPDRPQVLPLGTLWSYNNSGFWLAGRVIEVVTRMALEAAITELVFQPLGMNTSFFFEADAMTRRFAVGHIVGEDGALTVARPWSTPRAHRAAGGMLTTIADLMTFARVHVGDGRARNGVEVLSAETLKSMHEPLLPAAGSESAGISWVVRQLGGHRVVSHGGDWNGQQALITLVPDHGFGIGTLANSGQARSANDAIANWVLDHYLGVVVPKPIPVEVEDGRLDALVGRYAVPGTAIEIARRGNRLGIAYVPSISPTTSSPVIPEQPAALTADGGVVVLQGPFEGVTADFAIGPNGSAAWIRLGGRVYPRSHGTTAHG